MMVKSFLSGKTGTRKLAVPEAIHQMVVDHADCLHEGIANRAADELEAAFLKVLAHCIGLRSLVGHLFRGLPSVLLGPMTDELPEVTIKTAKLVLHAQENFGILDSGIDLERVPDDPRIRQQTPAFFGAI